MDSFLKFSNLVFPNLKNHIFLIPPASVASSSILYDQQQQHWKKHVSKVDEELNYYEILGVSQDSDEQQIRSAYKQLAKLLHPDHLQLNKKDDKTSDEPALVETSFEINLREEAELKMSELNEAFSVLNDPQRRKMYDFKILQQQNLNTAAKTSLSTTKSTNSFMRPFSRQKLWDDDFKTEKVENPSHLNIEHEVMVSLEDLYLGKSKKFEIAKQVICKTCSGYGFFSSVDPNSTTNHIVEESETTEITCKICQGRGTRKIQWEGSSYAKSHQLWRLSASSSKPTLVDCSYCSGKGSLQNKSVPHKKNKNTICQCQTCNGSGVIQEKQVIKVKIEKGMQHGDQIVKKGLGDEVLNTKLNQIVNGDLVLRLCQKPHSQFSRNGSNLYLHKKVTQQEANNGIHYCIQHLDGREIHIEQEKIGYQDTQCIIAEEGIPRGQGNLYIQYQIT